MELMDPPSPPSKQVTFWLPRVVYQPLAAVAAGAEEMDPFLCQEQFDCVTLCLPSPLRRLAVSFVKDVHEEASEQFPLFHWENDTRPFKLLVFSSQVSTLTCDEYIE